MKISNETKVGALTAVAITVLILGFNFLKGRNITDRNHVLYGVFPDVEGLAPASPVYVNGFQVGRVTDLVAKDENLSGILVTITLTKNVNLPVNSYATVTKTLLGTTSIKIAMGSSTTYLNEGDTLAVQPSSDLMTDVKNSINPAVNNINKTLAALESVIQKLNTVLDPKTQNNLQSIIANLNTASQSLTTLLDTRNGKLSHTLDNLESVTGNLAKNNNKIDASLSNLQQLTGKMAQLKLEETLAAFKSTLSELESTLAKANNRQSSIGALLNEKKLYEEVRQTNRSLNILLDDLKTNPKRYINVSVFGKKDRAVPLKKPIYDTLPDKGN